MEGQTVHYYLSYIMNSRICMIPKFILSSEVLINLDLGRSVHLQVLKISAVSRCGTPAAVLQLSVKRDQTYVSLMKKTSPCLYFDEVTWNSSFPWSWVWSFILHVSIKSQPWNGPTSCTWCFCLKNCFLDMVTSLSNERGSVCFHFYLSIIMVHVGK